MDSAGPPGGKRPLAGVGRARRTADARGELWRLDGAPVVRRLASLGASGVGGFVAWGEDDEGPWAVRRVASRTLDGLGRGERLPWREALGIARDLAAALAACERAALFPGPLAPEQIVLAPSVWLSAEPLVRALVGADDLGRTPSART
jgi:hypothetical protein